MKIYGKGKIQRQKPQNKQIIAACDRFETTEFSSSLQKKARGRRKIKWQKTVHSH